MRILLPLTLLMLACTSAKAEGPNIAGIVDQHILPGYARLSNDAQALARAADTNCAPDNAALRDAYHRAFDAWVRVSHLRFGPSEAENRAFALAFWPDPRSKTPKALSALLAAEDPVVNSPERFEAVSIAARGFYALEYLLYDPKFAINSPYACALIQAVTQDIETNTSALLEEWRESFGARLRAADNATFRSEREAAQQLFTALLTGLEFTADMRLGRPMGTFERPRPKRAEARRSGRSARHVIEALEGMRPLAALLSDHHPGLDRAFADALNRATALDDPAFAGVSDPQARLRIEVLQGQINAIKDVLTEDIGPKLGITAGFNALDGD